MASAHPGANDQPRPNIDLSGYGLEFEERFDGQNLAPDRWIAHYLPHWTTPDRSRARYGIDSGILRLRIDDDQPAWRDEDGPMRVSNIQTGVFSGPAGSSLGQHRHRPDLTVRTEQCTARFYTPTFGAVEAEMRASDDPTTMLAFWLVGHEEQSGEDSGEICVAEVFGNDIRPDRSVVRMGIKAHNDPRLADDMAEVTLRIDATQWHTYATEWTDDCVRFFVDGRLVCTVYQRIDYPLQVMIDLFEFPVSEHRDPQSYPKIGEVRIVRGYRLADSA